MSVAGMRELTNSLLLSCPNWSILFYCYVRTALCLFTVMSELVYSPVMMVAPSGFVIDLCQPSLSSQKAGY
jgi:hypothetical protein